MKESCVCCQAAAQKANGVDATLVLLFALAGDINVARIIDALCKKHGQRLDSMIYRALVPKEPLVRRGKRRRVKTDK